MRSVSAWVGGAVFRPLMESRGHASVSSQSRGRGRGRGHGRPYRGRGRGHGRGRGRGNRGRGGYQGGGVPFTPVAKGFKYFKHSFLENPWKALEEQQSRADGQGNAEEIEIDLDDSGSEEEDLKAKALEAAKAKALEELHANGSSSIGKTNGDEDA